MNDAIVPSTSAEISRTLDLPATQVVNSGGSVKKLALFAAAAVAAVLMSFGGGIEVAQATPASGTIGGFHTPGRAGLL